jgi:FkbM family methyltransferase
MVNLKVLRERVRVKAIRRLGGVLPQRGLSYPELLRLLYPSMLQDVDRHIVDEVSGGDLTDPATIRRMLGVVEHQLVPSNFSVFLTKDDVGLADVDGVEMFYDKADRSVSFQIQQGIYEPHITALFKRLCKPGMTVVDVGANIGYYALLASGLVGPKGRVVAIEPNSENCRLLLSSVRLKDERTNIVLLPVACDEAMGWAYYSKHIGSNGGLVDSDDLLARPGTVVPTFQLQDIVRDRVDLIKLDVEGAEYRIVAGARELIEREKPIIISELSRDMLARISGVTAEKYLEFFDGLGYELALIDRDTWEPVAFSSVEQLLERVEDQFQIENVLLTPSAS